MSAVSRTVDDAIRVLFIENDAAVAEMYKLKLELDGYQVTVVALDEEVLSVAIGLRPDMIFLDLRPGEERGLATLQRLRATDSTRNLPVIILSNQGAREMAGHGFKAHLLDYVVRADPGPNALTWNVEQWARAEVG
jgi:DNA-binding response OmpR family regulator